LKCRQCGTEIADKALICYRCGAATTDSVYKAPPADARLRRSRGGRGSVVATVLALALLVLLALYMGRATTAGVPQIVTWIAVAVAVIIVALRAFKKRN
jgi:uncharacterized membrane protein YvbJ